MECGSLLPLSGPAACCPPERASEQARRKRQRAAALHNSPHLHYPVILQLRDFDAPLPTPQGHVKVASIWSAGACSRFLGRQLAARQSAPASRRAESGSELPHSIIRPDIHYPVILQLRDFDAPLPTPQGHVKVASIWSAGACSRFLGRQLAARQSAPASRRAESGSKLPHSIIRPTSTILLSYSCGTLTHSCPPHGSTRC